jgi:hypothetical protein
VRPVTDGRTSFGVLLAQFGDIAATTQPVIDAQQRQLGAILDRAAQVARTVADPEAAAYEVAAGQRRPVPRVPAGRVGSRLGPVPPARPVPVHDRGRGAGHDLPRAGAAAAETDDAYLAGLVRALDDLLHPMANLCSGGKAKTLSRAALIDILARGGAR